MACLYDIGIEREVDDAGDKRNKNYVNIPFSSAYTLFT